MAQRKAVTASQARKWPKASRAEKSEILDAVCSVTGWHRDHARKMIRQAATGTMPTSRRPRVPVLTYPEEVIDALAVCWAVLDGPTGKCLAPALADLLPGLVAHHELPDDPGIIDALLAMSPATMDRRLKPHRLGLVQTKGRSMTRPGSLLKSQIPLKTWHEWDDTKPGFIEIDLVAHDGGDNNGHYHWSLDATDVATGWTEAITITSKGERIVAAGLDQLRVRFPFAILGVHSDNGSEFINHHLLRWSQHAEITFTRGRPNHKNDQAFVEQKNWTLVRRCAGYYRYDTPRELDLLNQLWNTERLLFNLFRPQAKLASKTRQGAKITKTYDLPTTPLKRLHRDHPGWLTPQDENLLNHQLTTLNPAQLARDIDLIQTNILELARRRGITQRRAKANHVYLSKTKITTPNKRASPHESTTQTKRAS